jgi:hypothetical protein
LRNGGLQKSRCCQADNVQSCLVGLSTRIALS